LSDEGKELSVPFLTQKVSTKPNAPTMAELCNLYALPPIADFQLPYYAQLLRELAQKREIQRIGSDLVHCGTSEGSDIESAVERADEALKSLFANGATNTITMHEVLTEVHQRINENLSGIVQRGSLTGFRWLDEKGGFQKSDLILICGASSMGKTAFALNIAQNVAIKENVPICIFSLEMSATQLTQRMLCSHAEVDAQRLKTGNMLQKDWESLTNAMTDFSQAPIFIDDTSGCTLTDIRTKCRRLKTQQKDLGLIVIDYLQLMEGGGKEDRLQQISAMSRGLKILAKELDVPIICLSQLSRAVESRNDKRPMLSDLRESGSIEQDADIVMFIYREEYYNKAESEDEERIKAQNKGLSEIIVAKHRNGPVGTCKLLFQNNITKFKNYVEQSFDAF
jgi:replicative DNA helicase